MTRPSRVSRGKILEQLRLASKKGDRNALTLATEQMKTLAFSPRYWEKYLDLLVNPLARLVDLLLIKQGDRIARQKGWTRPRRERADDAGPSRAPRRAEAFVAPPSAPRPSSRRSSPTFPPDRRP